MLLFHEVSSFFYKRNLFHPDCLSPLFTGFGLFLEALGRGGNCAAPRRQLPLAEKSARAYGEPRGERFGGEDASYYMLT